MADKEILIKKGETFTMDIRWELADSTVRLPVTGVSLAFGAPRLIVVGHGLTAGWLASPYGIGGMKQLNDVGYQPVKVIDVDTIELNKVTPVDDNDKMWPAYTSGGFIQFYEPQDLAGYTARMDIKDKVGGTVLLSSEVADSPLNKIILTVNNANKKTTMSILATDAAAITFKKGVAGLEMVSGAGIVTRLKLTSAGNPEDPDPVRVSGEVTT